MAKVYHIGGKPLDIIKREAKDLRKNSGVKLKDAQAQIARENGHQTWQALMESAIEYDEDGGPVYLVFSRQAGKDEVVFDCIALQEMLEDGEFDTEDMPALYVHKSLEHLGDGAVSWRISVIGTEENTSRGGGDLKHLLRRSSTKEVNDYADAIDAACEGMPGDFIALMHEDGVFDIDPRTDLIDVEFEALLELEMRKKGVQLRDRTLFNDESSSRPSSIIDWERRAFAHNLSDGRVLISNGSSESDNLKWHVMDRGDLDALVAEMEEEIGDEAFSTQRGEIWVHQRVLDDADAPEPEM